MSRRGICYAETVSAWARTAEIVKALAAQYVTVATTALASLVILAAAQVALIRYALAQFRVLTLEHHGGMVSP